MVRVLVFYYRLRQIYSNTFTKTTDPCSLYDVGWWAFAAGDHIMERQSGPSTKRFSNMNIGSVLSKWWFLPLAALPLVAWLIPSGATSQTELIPEHVNLALRRTADGLLRISGDSTSRIPAVEMRGDHIWKMRLDYPFSYDSLPILLQASLQLHGVHTPYDVTIRRCTDDEIVLGYHQFDITESQAVPCGGRVMEDGCHFIELAFLLPHREWSYKKLIGMLSILLIGALGGYWLARRQKKGAPFTELASDYGEWLQFGNAQLDVSGQVLICGGLQQNLTFRETKLLALFAENANKLIERDTILQQVWADEGVLVGRSLDMFVSRLRKKLAPDADISIIAVHGVGYRLETSTKQ